MKIKKHNEVAVSELRGIKAHKIENDTATTVRISSHGGEDGMFYLSEEFIVELARLADGEYEVECEYGHPASIRKMLK